MAILPKGDEGKSLIQSFQSIAGSIWSCVPGPIQYTAILAYSGNRNIDDYIKTCTKIHGIRTHYVHGKLSSMGLTSPKPRGAFYIYPSFKKWSTKLEKMGITTCEELSTYLLDHYSIATLPGSAFGDDTNNLCLRLSTSFLDMETDDQAQKILDAYSEENDPKLFMEKHHPRTTLFLEKMRKFIAEINE